MYLFFADNHSVGKKFYGDIFNILDKSFWWLDNRSMDFCFYLGILCKKEIMDDMMLIQCCCGILKNKHIPPAEYEAKYWRGIDKNNTVGLTQTSLH